MILVDRQHADRSSQKVGPAPGARANLPALFELHSNLDTPMVVMQCTLRRLPIEHDMQAIRPCATGRRPPDDAASLGLVIVAHLASLASVGALVIALTLGSIAMARCFTSTDAVPGLAATAPDDEGGLRISTTAGSSR